MKNNKSKINQRQDSYGFQLTILAMLLYMLLVIGGCAHNNKVTKIIKSTTSAYDYAQVEPSLYVNRLNPNEIIAGTVLNDYYTSKDGGKTWNSSVLSSPLGVNGDPVLLIDDQSNYYYFHLSNPKSGKWLDRIVCQRTNSIDAPMETVGHTMVNGKVHDKHWVSYDGTTKTLHLAWTQFDGYKSKLPLDSTIIVYSQSKDFGVTWSTPLRVSPLSGNCLDNSGTIEGVSICNGLNSEIFITYCLNEKIYLNTSLDDGATWLNPEREIALQPGGWDFDIPGIYRMNGFPSLQIDHSTSAQRGRLYLSWSDQRKGKNNTDIWISYSDDKGKTWSDAKPINNDQGEHHQFMSTMRVDPNTGYVIALFYDRRKHKDWKTDVYLAYSKDGSKTFKNIKINKKPFLPDPKKFFGDYLALDALNGIAYAMWPEMHHGKISLKFSKVNIK